jgi:hypothetical protein
MSGSSTRDWLLDKLMKLRQAMTELKVDYEKQLADADTRLNAANVRIANLKENYMVAHHRMLQLASEKQFSVVYRGSSGARLPLPILAVNSSNGQTVITVGRA